MIDLKAVVPKELQAIPNWFLWRLEPEGGKVPYKVGLTATLKDQAKTTNPAHWEDFYIAAGYVETFPAWPEYVGRQDLGLLKGVGFNMLNSGCVGVDLDKCIDANGQLSQMAREIIDTLNSYTEISPSGHGIRIMLHGCNLPGDNLNPGNVKGLELYGDKRGRYLSITGNVFEGRADIAGPEAQERVNAIYKKYAPAKKYAPTEKIVDAARTQPGSQTKFAPGQEITLKEAIDYIRENPNAALQTFTGKAKRGAEGQEVTYICPLCGHGDAESTHGWGLIRLKPAIIKKETETGEEIKEYDGNLLHCNKCGFTGDVIQLYKKTKALEDYSEAARELAQLLGLNVIKGGFGAVMSKAFQQEAAKPLVLSLNSNFQDYYNSLVAGSDPSAANYLHSRGLTDASISRFNLLFDAKVQRVVIPFSDSFYTARTITGQDPRYLDPKDIPRQVFNLDALYSGNKAVYVVEGVFDAISIVQAGGAAVALHGTNMDMLVDALKQKPTDAVLLLSMDNDYKDGLDQLVLKLEAAGARVALVNVAGNYKDASEYLEKDASGLAATIAGYAGSLVQAQKAELAQYQQDLRVDNLLQNFLIKYDNFAIDPISTGFTQLDQALHGGFSAGIYCIGALSGLGKTTFCLNMASNMALNNRDVLYFSLEMPAATMLMKLLSRNLTIINFSQGDKGQDNCKTALDFITPAARAAITDLQQRRIMQAVDYTQNAAKHLYIHEGNTNYTAFSVDQLIKTVERHIWVTGNKPVVFVDYLQILAPRNDRMTDKQNVDANVTALIQLARKYKIPVIVISSLNRQNYSRTIDQGAFKESGIIEYSADGLIGLQYAGAGTSDFNIDAAVKQQPRQIELKLIKGRLVDSGAKIRFNFVSKYNLYLEVN